MKRAIKYLGTMAITWVTLLLVQWYIGGVNSYITYKAIGNIYWPHEPLSWLVGVSNWWLLIGFLLGLFTIGFRMYRPGKWVIDWTWIICIALPLWITLPWWSPVNDYRLKVLTTIACGWALVNALVKDVGVNEADLKITNSYLLFHNQCKRV